MEKISTTITLSTALDIFAENITDIKSTLLDNIQYVIQEVKEEHSFVTTFVNKLHEETWNECIAYQIEERTATMRRVLKRIIARQQQALTPNSNYITDEHIATAKEYPLQELYDGKLQKIHTGYKGICPFSPEKTPSFFIKENKNRYKCFGCNESGDAINFYMKLHNVPFIKAVRALQKL